MKPAPKPLRAPKKRRSERKQLEAELEAIIRELVWWRDSGECIEKAIDGARCGGSLQWGHFIPRRQSRWMKFTLATFVQCANHNLLHDKGSPTMSTALALLLGKDWMLRQEIERAAHRDGKVPIWELRDRIERYRLLLDNRPSLYTTEQLVELGYYG